MLSRIAIRVKGVHGPAFRGWTGIHAASTASSRMRLAGSHAWRSSPRSPVGAIGSADMQRTGLVPSPKGAPVVNNGVANSLRGVSSSVAPCEPQSSGGGAGPPSLVDKAVTLAPGVAAAGVVMKGSFYIADYLGHALLAAQGLATAGAASPISGIPVAILLGMAINNTVTLPESLRPGLKACTVTALRAGIVCVGAKLSFFELARLGAVGVPVVAVTIGTGLTFIPWLARKLDLPPRFGSLLAAGTSICGVTAITAVAPTIKAEEKEVGLAVANVVAFGTIGMLSYPYLGHALLAHSEQVGMFLGTAIHDTSQVMGAALTYKQVFADEVALKMATITKLTRNAFLAGVIPLIAWQHARAQPGADAGSAASLFTLATLKKYVPMFVLGFLGMSALRSLGDVTLANSGAAYGLFEAAQWKSLTSTLGGTVGSRYLLGTAMAAVGLNTSVAVFKGVGWKPFAAGFAGCVVVGGTGFTMAVLAGHVLGLDAAAAEAAVETARVAADQVAAGVGTET